MHDKLTTIGQRLRFVIVVSVVVLFAVVTFPQLVGANHSYVVLSDSMEPTLSSGDVVIVEDVPGHEIQRGDVITYEQTKGLNDRVTHRVVAVRREDGKSRFKTKGDANEDPDPRWISEAQVVGRVAFAIPYVGYVLTFAETDLGLVTLVIVPAVLLMLSEAWALFRAYRTTRDLESGSVETRPSSDGD